MNFFQHGAFAQQKGAHADADSPQTFFEIRCAGALMLAAGGRQASRAMIARLLRWLLLVQLAIVCVLAPIALRFWNVAPSTGASASAGAGTWALALVSSLVVVLLLRAWITAQNFGLSWCYRSATPLQYRLHLWARCRLFLDEFAATMLASCWTMAWPKANWHIVPGATGLPVLLVHGYACNSGYWTQLGALLEQQRISHHAVDLEPLGAAIDDHAAQLQRAVEALCARSGSSKVIIVAHSMGGLVVRAYLRVHGSKRIARVITLGTPHHGTSLARFGIGSNARQMCCQGQARGSDWLASLAANESAAQRALLTSIFSHHDNIVAPQTSCRLPGAKNIEFGGVGHVAMGRDHRILQCVLDEIRLVLRNDAAAVAVATATSGAAHDVCGSKR
jgi:triacylglycerol esterase/lipase EstA (alpha/beta hydrolase family)